MEREARPAEPSEHALEGHPEYVKSIGMVSLEAIALELRLALLLARMLSISLKTAQAIYLTPKAEQTRLDILRNAAHAEFSVTPSKANSPLGKKKIDALKKVKSIIARAEKVIRKRHRVIHDEWNYSDVEKKVTRRLIDGQPGRERVPTPKSELDALIHDMRIIIDDSYALAKEFKQSPPTMVSLKIEAKKQEG